MEKYLAFDGINGEIEFFFNLKDAEEWLKEWSFDKEEGYHPDAESCCIYKLCREIQIVKHDKGYKHKFINHEPSNN